MAKIIPFSVFKPPKLPLSALMIKSLRYACEMQSRNQIYGQAELHGSFMALVKRELIDYKNVTISGELQVSWFVTKAGINALENLDITHKC